MTALIALSIDAMLPALPSIGRDLGAETENDQQLVVSALFFGFAFAQMIFGPLSDSIGRKRSIYMGYGIFLIGCLMSILSTNFDIMLAGRVLQGVGAAGPRIVCLALLRDQYEGREMARIMSFVMAVFILVPALAPALGHGIIMISHWRAIFVVMLILAIASWTWFAVRQPETLPPENRVRFSLKKIWSGVTETCRNRISFGYTLMTGLIFGAFIGYLTTAQQIFSTIYGITDMFPLYFGSLALAIGFSSIINARLVMKVGMRPLLSYSLKAMTVISLLFYGYAVFVDGTPELWLSMGYFGISFLGIGLLFGNFNALAMEPLGHIAGVGAAVVGSLSTLISTLLGWYIGQMFDGTLLPLVGGFALLGTLSMATMWWTEAGRTPELSIENAAP